MMSKMSRLHYALALALVAWSGSTVAAPNILLLIADDYGFDKSSLYVSGNDVPPTPAIEALAREGVTYDNVWSSQSCSPTRATMLTGQFGSRNGISGVIVPPADRLIAEDTVEEKILQLQGSKRKLADAILEGGEGQSLKDLTADDLKMLLS